MGTAPATPTPPFVQLAICNWARGEITTYTYDDLQQLTAVSYFDCTSDVT